MTIDVTVIVPTLNEALHIERCLRSVAGTRAQYVVDAHSTDSTRELASQLGAQVVTHEWRGYSDQKNWALANLPIQTEWVLFLDADEAVSPELMRSIEAVVASDHAADGYFVNRRLVFMGRTLKHAWWYPDRVLRLFRHGRGRFDDRFVHERVLLSGRSDVLNRDLIHENRKDLFSFVDRHNRYSSLEAEQMVTAKRNSRHAVRLAYRGDPAERRRALKERIWWRLPLLVRPVIRFTWMYVVRRGFLDGLEGLLYSLLIASYELQIDAKIIERRRLNQNSGGLEGPQI